jgi:hypothetical protein
MLDESQQKYGREIHFVNRQGAVTMHGCTFPNKVTILGMKPG